MSLGKGNFKVAFVFAVIFAIILVLPGFSTGGKKVLFYEVQAATTMRITSSGYTRFNALLQGAGYSTASISSSDVKLTQEKLVDYDVVIMQGLNKALDTEEILALRWYVGVRGGGLLINGDEPEGVNNLGQIYGILMDKRTTWLVDTANFPFNETGPDGVAIPVEDRKYYALVRNFPDKTDPQGISLSDVNKIAVYKAHPLFVESVRVNSPIGKTKVIATGSNLSYTETGTFPVGSEPPIAARAFFGSGAVVVISDFDILSDANIYDRDYFNETINNDKFGLAIINWLSDTGNREITLKSDSELALKVLDLQSKNIALDQGNRTWFSEASKLKSDLANTTASYEKALSDTKTTMQEQVTRCETKLGECSNDCLKKMGMWGLVGLFLGAGVVGGIIISKKFKRKPGPADSKGKPSEQQKKQQIAKDKTRQERLDEVKESVATPDEIEKVE